MFVLIDGWGLAVMRNAQSNVKHAYEANPIFAKVALIISQGRHVMSVSQVSQVTIVSLLVSMEKLLEGSVFAYRDIQIPKVFV